MAINGNSCTKVGLDSDGPEVTPETRNFTPDPERERLSVEFFSKYLPKVETSVILVSQKHYIFSITKIQNEIG